MVDQRSGQEQSSGIGAEIQIGSRSLIKELRAAPKTKKKW